MTRNRFSPRLAAAALAAALMGAAAVPAMAQPAPAPAPAAAAERPHHRAMTPEQLQQRQQRMNEFQAQRAEAFKQKLQITPAQESAWNTFQQAMKPGERHARLDSDRQALAQLTTPERIDRMRALRTQRTAEADRRGDAVKAFYATLTPAQQKTFDTESGRMHGRGFGKGDKGPRGEKHGRHHGQGGPAVAPKAQ